MTFSSTLRPGVLLGLLATVLASAPVTGMAQDAQQKTGSLGTGNSTGPLLTRDELRACMKRQDALQAQRPVVEAERQALEAERTAIEKESAAVKAQLAGVETINSKVGSLNERQRDLGERISNWNQRFKDYEDSGRSGPLAERRRASLLREQKDMDSENEALTAEREQMGSASDAVATINQRVGKHTSQITAWNERSAKTTKLVNAYEQEREYWAAECGSRRYIDKDEDAIRAGK